jgi:hypothetical protein
MYIVEGTASLARCRGVRDGSVVSAVEPDKRGDMR